MLQGRDGWNSDSRGGERWTQVDSTTDPVLQSRFFLEAYPSLYYLRDGQTRQYLSARNLQHVRCRKATNGIVTAYAAGLTGLET